MKSTLLKTLAATSLVATAQAEVHVLGASFKERGVFAPAAPPLPGGTIIPNPGTVAATRGYLIMDDTATGATPNKATYIEYGEIRDAGVVTRFYTVDTDFVDYRADNILGATGGLRTYGHMHAPVWVADVTNPLIPFSGTTLPATSFPRKLSFDQTTYQTGSSDALAGPGIVTSTATASTMRSVVSGSANPVNVTASTISGATTELVARLKKQGYEGAAGEAPEIITDITPLTLTLQDGNQQTVSITVDDDIFPPAGPAIPSFPAPTIQWYKNDVPIIGANGLSLTIVGGPTPNTTGAGSYKVVVSNALGSDTSSTLVVTSAVTSFSTDLPAAQTIIGQNMLLLAPVLSPAPVSAPTYQWLKSTTANGTFNAITAPPAGNGPTLSILPGEANTGAGFYRLDVTTSAGTISSAVCNVTLNAAVGTTFAYTVNLPRTMAVPFSPTTNIGPTINPAVGTPAVASRQWYKAAPGSTTFTAIAAGDGGTVSPLAVSGNNAALHGPGTYRMVATSVAPVTVITTVDCVVTTAP